MKESLRFTCGRQFYHCRIIRTLTTWQIKKYNLKFHRPVKLEVPKFWNSLLSTLCYSSFILQYNHSIFSSFLPSLPFSSTNHKTSSKHRQSLYCSIYLPHSFLLCSQQSRHSFLQHKNHDLHKRDQYTGWWVHHILALSNHCSTNRFLWNIVHCHCTELGRQLENGMR